MEGAAVSIVVPFYQAEDTIGRCVTSLLKQEEPARGIEILLVDNNATDRSAEIARSFEDPRIRVLVERRQGAYAARNRALAEATGEIIAFTDPDCEAEPTWLRELTEPFEDPAVGVVMGRVLPGGFTPLLDLLSEYERTKEAFVLGGEAPELYFGRTNNMAVRRELLDEVGAFVERARGSDTLFVRRAIELRSTDTVRYRPSARVRHSEVASVRDYLGKVVVYARSSRAPHAGVAVPLLSRGQRWRLAATTCQELGFGPVRFAGLLGVLGAEGLAWRYGRIRP